MERNRPNTDNPPLDKPVFCTACGAQLEEFCFSRKATDVEAIRRKLAACRETGKFTGGTCAMLFIANPEDFP